MLPIQLELFPFVERALEHIPQHRWSKEDSPWLKHVKLLNMAQGLIDHDRVLNGQSVLITHDGILNGGIYNDNQ